MAKREAEQAAIVLLGLFDGLAIVLFGEKARMLDYEREMINDPLQRIIERSNLLNAEAVNKYSDPLLLTMGLIGWFSRVNRERKESPPAPAPDEIPQAQPGPGKNGKRAEIPPDILATEQLKAPGMFGDQMNKGGLNVKF